jgi:hypothetical protein
MAAKKVSYRNALSTQTITKYLLELHKNIVLKAENINMFVNISCSLYNFVLVKIEIWCYFQEKKNVPLCFLYTSNLTRRKLGQKIRPNWGIFYLHMYCNSNQEQRPNSWTKSRHKSLESFLPCYSQSPLQLCPEISISSNSRNLLQFLQFSYCRGERRKS